MTQPRSSESTVRRQRPVLPPEERAARLKERVYITFTALAVVLAMTTHSSELEAVSANLTLVVAVTGTLLAVFVADFISHLAVHQHLPSASELRHMTGVSLGALGILPLPFIALGGAALGAWSVPAALTAAAAILLGSLIVIGYLAVRRTRLPLWQRLIALGAEALLGALVVGLELFAHG